MHLVEVGLAYPPHHVDQGIVSRTLGSIWDDISGFVTRVHSATGVSRRHLALPIETYTHARTFGDSNARFISMGTDLAEAAIHDGLLRARLEPRDVDFLLVVSTTGVACPSIDAHLVQRVGFRHDVRRLPIVGLGCAGGAAALARCADLLRGGGDAVALAVCVELCSLTFRLDDVSMANVVATGLFGDAAACAVVATGRLTRSGAPTILGSRSMFQEDTADVLGFEIDERGFRVVLGRELPEVAVHGLADQVDGLLDEYGISRRDIEAWIVHPGGPKVLRAIAAALELPALALAHSWKCLRTVGNVSSASVLCILRDVIAEPPRAGSYGVVLGMGPGFSAEAILLRW